MPLTVSDPPALRPIAVETIRPSPFSLAIYGDPGAEIDDLIESIRSQGVLVPLVADEDQVEAGLEILDSALADA